MAVTLPDHKPKKTGVLRNMRRLWQQVGTLRIVATVTLLLIALLVARYSWSIPFADEIERVLFDVRASYAMERVEEDDRILVVVYTEDTLIETEVRSPVDRVILARALRNLDAMNPRGIAIDILFDQSTPNDEQLIEAFESMDTRTYNAFASSRYNPLDMQPRQEDFLADFDRRIDNEMVGQTSVLLYADGDNVQRSWPEQPPILPPLMANALAPGHEKYRSYTGSIAYRLPLYEDGAVFTKLPIDWFADPEMASGLADFVEGRYVLIGADLQDRDRFETPLSRLTGGNTTAGVEIHAHLLAQMLDGVMPRALPGWALWFTGFFVIVAGGLTSLSEMRLWKLALVVAIQAGLLVVFPFWLQQSGTDTLTLPVFGWGTGWTVAFIAVGAAARSVGAEKRHYVTGALGKYLPADVTAQILSDPESLLLHGEKRVIYALFTDLEGFTKLSHAIEPEMVATLLNRYLDQLSEIVLDHGGTLDKFVGDAVIAFWGAPISRPDDATRASKCAIAMYKAGEDFRQNVPEGVPPIGCTRVGLHCGEAIVGNFGGEDRIQYTALGDAMNTGARLEGANKFLKTKILVSREATLETDDILFRPMGRVTLSGRATPVEVYEPVMEITDDSSEKLHTLYRKYENGDKEAIDEIALLARNYPDDLAIQGFAERLRQTKPGGSYVLQGK